MTKWVSILDGNVVKPGMQCRTCLDHDMPMDASDDGNDDEEYLWFEATVLSVEKARLNHNFNTYGYRILVRKKKEKHSEWSVFLNSDNYEFFEVTLNAWDD